MPVVLQLLPNLLVFAVRVRNMENEALALMVEGYANLCNLRPMHILTREVDIGDLQAIVKEGMEVRTAA